MLQGSPLCLLRLEAQASHHAHLSFLPGFQGPEPQFPCLCGKRYLCAISLTPGIFGDSKGAALKGESMPACLATRVGGFHALSFWVFFEFSQQCA